MKSAGRIIHKLCLHGHPISLANDLPYLQSSLDFLLSPFVVDELPPGFSRIEVELRPYFESEVLRHLSPAARHIPTTQPWIELYQDADRFWLIDERWGLSEINFLRGQIKSFILTHASLDTRRLAEAAILWPLAQLLRPRGLHLLPAVSFAQADRGILLLAPFSLEPELTTLAAAGYTIISQRWTALREESGQLELLHLPGHTQRHNPAASLRSSHDSPAWINLAPFPQRHAFADRILIADSRRRNEPRSLDLPPGQARELLKRAWPILDIHPTRRTTLPPLPRCTQIHLSHDPHDLLSLLRRVPPVSRFQPQARPLRSADALIHAALARQATGQSQ